MAQAAPTSPNAPAIGKADYQKAGRMQSGGEPAQELFRVRNVLYHAGADNRLVWDCWQVAWACCANPKFDIERVERLVFCHSNHGWRRIKRKHAIPVAREHQRDATRPAPVVQDKAPRFNMVNGCPNEKLAPKVSSLLDASVDRRSEPDCRFVKYSRLQFRSGEV